MERTIVKFKLNDRLFIRDPQETELGTKIIEHSILLIDELGFEHFTFKKLAIGIESTEASVYRYFENKNMLLIYLVSWYWVWLDYKIQFYTNNIVNPKERLTVVLSILCGTIQETFVPTINEKSLYRIVVAESAKAYLIKEVDEVNKYGVYLNYKTLNKKIAAIILEINPQYAFPNALVSTVIESAHQQLFFAEHLPSLTNVKNNKSKDSKILEFIESIVWSCLNNK